MSYTTYVLPFKKMRFNYQETMNETFALLASYHLFTFTEWVYDLDARYSMGWSLIGFVIVLLVANVAMVGTVLLREAIHKARVKYYARRRAKRIAEHLLRKYLVEKDDPDDKRFQSSESEAVDEVKSVYDKMQLTIQNIQGMTQLDELPMKFTNKVNLSASEGPDATGQKSGSAVDVLEAFSVGDWVDDSNDWVEEIQGDDFTEGELIPRPNILND